MKRIISMFAVIALLLIFATPVYAEESFPVNIFEGKDGYEYDKFTKSWSYYQAYVERYSDARIVIGIDIGGEGSVLSMPPTIYCWIRDANNKECLYSVNELYFLIGERVFHIDNLYEGDTSSSVWLGNNAKDLLLALGNANSITVRLGTKYADFDIEISESDYKSTLRTAANLIYKSEYWKYLSESDLAMVDDLFVIEEF